MKCPDCGLVTFDHLSRCPKCQASFRLARRLTRRPDPSRRIVLPTGPRRDDVEPRPAPGAPSGQSSATTTSRTEDTGSSDPGSRHEADADAPAPGRSAIDADELTPAPASSGFRASFTRTGTGSVKSEAEPADRGRKPRPELAAAAQESAGESLEAAREPGPRPAQESRGAGPERPGAGGADRDGRVAGHPASNPRRARAAEHEKDRHRLKQRMVASSRKRRSARVEATAGAVDPLLPAWYLPATDDHEAESGPTTGSGTE